jgi:hypothetical protein
MNLLPQISPGQPSLRAKKNRCLPLNGVGVERAVAVVMLTVCAVSVCTGVCAAVLAAAVRVMRLALVGNEGVSVVSVAEGRTKRASALDRSRLNFSEGSWS